MLFKFPLPGPLKGKLLPKEGLDGDRLRAGLGFLVWVLRGSQEGTAIWGWLGFGLGFLASVPGRGSGPGFRAGLSGVPREDCGLGPSWGWFLVWVPGLGSGLVWISGLGSQGGTAISGWPGFSEKKCIWGEQKYLSPGIVNLEPSIAPQPDAGERAWSDCA